MVRALRMFIVPALVIAAIGAAMFGGGLGVARQTTGTPCPDASPAASPEASPEAAMASPAADACASPMAAGGEVTIDMVDIAFVPTEITIPADTDVTIMLPNKGASVHNFNVDELDVHSGDAPGGQTVSVTIKAPAGEYEFYCSIPGHKESGMVGTLIVE